MELKNVYIKENYNEYLHGQEVIGKADVSNNKMIYQGDHVMVYKDSIAATSDVAVPKEKLSRNIGIEGTVTSLGFDGSDQEEGKKVQLIKVKKV